MPHLILTLERDPAYKCDLEYFPPGRYPEHGQVLASYVITHNGEELGSACVLANTRCEESYLVYDNEEVAFLCDEFSDQLSRCGSDAWDKSNWNVSCTREEWIDIEEDDEDENEP
jgi:hypothetical protein